MTRLVFVTGLFLALVLTACGGASNQRVQDDATSQSLTDWHHFESLQDLVDHSDAVVVARVIRRLDSVDLRADPKQRIPVSFTNTEVSVERNLKGSLSGTLVVQQVGKEGDPAQRYPEFPLLRPSTTVLLFLADVSGTTGSATTRYGVLAPEGLYEVNGGSLSSQARGFTVAETLMKSPLSIAEAQVIALSRK